MNRTAANAIILLRWDARFQTAPTGFVLRPAGISVRVPQVSLFCLRWDARFQTAPTGFGLRPAGIYYFALGCAVGNRAYGVRAKLLHKTSL